MRRKFVLTLVLLSLCALAVRADQVTLKNGDRLSGTIIKSSDDAKSLLIKTELAGEVTISWDAIAAIVSSQPLHLTLSDGRVAVGTVSTVDGKIEVATKDAGTVDTAHDAVKAILSKADSFSSILRGSGSFVRPGVVLRSAAHGDVHL